MVKDVKPTGRAKGGIERAKNLDPTRRSEIASKAAAMRWKSAELPVAEYGSADRPLRILDSEIPCYVLSDGTRVLTQEGFLSALGRARKAKGGTGASTLVDNLPAFLSANNIKPLISNELYESTNPIEFRLPTGGKAFGFRAELLPKVCNVYLQARDKGLLLSSQKRIAEKADMLVRGLAETGIVALVDEATGYQQVRARDALQAFLNSFLRKELAAWVKTFPDEFFQELFRLKRWKWSGTSRRPSVVGHYINDLVYDRLGPGVLDELKRKNPTDANGRRKAKHFQWLTEDIGNPALAQHMYALIGFMRAEDDWEAFKSRFYRSFPKKGDTLTLL
ncbi:MAG: P63C domain-containing protein [Acidobacteriaceae bacterium]